VTTLVFHDLPETRIGDLHRVATRYIKGKDKAEEQICHEQMTDMP
jgi:5'-deoxynucleotidase YfbR-like HD superfamily hydrolase